MTGRMTGKATYAIALAPAAAACYDGVAGGAGGFRRRLNLCS